jgi:hypothetical protein
VPTVHLRAARRDTIDLQVRAIYNASAIATRHEPNGRRAHEDLPPQAGSVRGAYQPGYFSFGFARIERIEDVVCQTVRGGDHHLGVE